MLDLFARVIAYTSLPVLAAIAGSIVAAFRPPGGRVRSYIQHFAAGVVFSVVAVEILPDVMRRHEPIEIIAGFTLGVAMMLGISRLTRDADKGVETGRTAGLIAAVGVDLAIDGLLIGMGFSVGTKEGVLLTLALTVELLSLGLAVTGSLRKAGKTRQQSIIATSLLAVTVPAGAVLGATVLSRVPERALEGVLSFGLAALLYLVTEELLVEAHEEPETPFATSLFFAGFLLLLVIASISGP